MSDDKPRDTPPDETQPVRPQGEVPGAAEPAGSALPPAPDPAAPTPDPAPAPAAASYADAPAQRRGFRERFRTLRRSDGDRTFGLGALIASALAGVIVGGVGVAAVSAVADDHRDGPGWGERHGPMGRDFGDDDDRGPGFGGPGRMPGQLQPTTPPDDEDGSAS
jgi:hypothetical protein